MKTPLRISASLFLLALPLAANDIVFLQGQVRM
jgi:hypothetical protein